METIYLAYLLILVGLALLVAEVFIPSGGILFVLALAAIVVGVTLTFSVSTQTGFGTLVLLIIAIPTVLAIAFYFWPRTPIGKRFILQAPPEDDTLAKSPVNLELEQLRGRYGRTISALRPAGTTMFDGRRVDTITEGGMIGPDQWVQCIDVQGGRVIVRQVEAPPNLEDLDPTDLT